MECSHSQLLRDSNNFFFILTVLRYQPIQDSSNRPFQSAQELTSQALQKQGEESPKLGFSERIAYSYFHVSLWSCKWITTGRIMCQRKWFLPKRGIVYGPWDSYIYVSGYMWQLYSHTPKTQYIHCITFPSCAFSKMLELPTLSSDLQYRHIIYLFMYLFISFRKEWKDVKMFQKEMTIKWWGFCKWWLLVV